MTTRGRISVATLSTGVAGFVASIVLAVIASSQFRDALAALGGQACGTQGGPAGLAGLATAIAAAGLVLGTVAAVVARAPVVRLASIVLAGSSALAVLFNGIVMHAISTCAPYAGG